MRNYEVDLYRTVITRQHTRVSVDAVDAQEASQKAVEMSNDQGLIWSERIPDPPRYQPAKVGEVEAIVDLDDPG